MTVWHSVMIEQRPSRRLAGCSIAEMEAEQQANQAKARAAYEKTIGIQESGWTATKADTWEELPYRIKQRWFAIAAGKVLW